MKPPRRALRHDVRDGIVRSILDGEHRPGDRLIEMQIAKAYGTSQGPVREALRELEMLGFVRSEMHRGTYVRDPWHLGMRELFQVRGALEEFAARLATPRLCEDVTALQAEVDAMREAAERSDNRAAVEHSERFHRHIVLASENQLLHTMWSSLCISDHTALDDGHADARPGRARRLAPADRRRDRHRRRRARPARSAVVTRRVSSRCSPRRWTARRCPPRSVTSATPRAPRRRRR